MRIYLAGASGAMGKALVPMLIESGHEVVGTTRSQANAAALRATGAEPDLVDALDADAVRRSVKAARPDVVIHQLTALGGAMDWRRIDRSFAQTNELRRRGTEHLLAAARDAGARRFLAQSFTGWPNDRSGAKVKTEEDPLDPKPHPTTRESHAAIRALESAMLTEDALEAIALRYGMFYGPGTGWSQGGDMIEAVRTRKLPLVGDGAGVWSFVHIEDAARATLAAVDRGAPGLYNIVDDEPATVSQWLPYLAEVVKAPRPMKVPAWLARVLAGGAVVSNMTLIRGSSNGKARRELGWEPTYPSWREGFRTLAE